VDAVQQLLADAPIDPHAITGIKLETYSYATKPIFRVDPNPPSRDVAGLSIRVATAVALTHGDVMPDDLADWDAPLVQKLRQMVEIEIEPEIEAQYPNMNGCRLHVTLASGDTRIAYLPNMKGEPEFPMTEADLKTKFTALTHRLFNAERGEALYNLCARLETLSDINSLLELARAEAPATVNA
jgi:2-methylcitrate dehydratase PrpD